MSTLSLGDNDALPNILLYHIFVSYFCPHSRSPLLLCYNVSDTAKSLLAHYVMWIVADIQFYYTLHVL